MSADGNGRWATSRGLPRSAGHDASREAFASGLSACVELNIPYLSIHVFSSENWGRPEPEVRKLIELFSRVLALSLHDFNELGVRFRRTGSRLEVPADLRRTVEAIEKTTSANGHVTLQFGLNYGGRKELVDAAAGLARAAMAGEIRPEEVAGFPQAGPDERLGAVRPSGAVIRECRVSTPDDDPPRDVPQEPGSVVDDESPELSRPVGGQSRGKRRRLAVVPVPPPFHHRDVR
ncbi:undecaprenyl diphosphate synthase family protein [Nonomuraea sp. NPDC050022]|uniref:undecaprenyl diphosphate synthase family protein n=1 Tax=Nonomuraea sp. NPDC050022 TaxID=3364358 RepID=UPI0037AF32A9